MANPLMHFGSRPMARGEGRFIRQSSAINRFAHVVLDVEFGDPAEAIQIEWLVSEDAIPDVYRRSIERGVVRLFEPDTPLDGYCSDGLVVRVVDGTNHPTDSNELSFELAAAAALKNALGCA